MPVISIPWINVNRALTIYSPSRNSRISPILPKSIPPLPPILFIRPLNSSVVAVPNIFGPTIMKMVPATAQMITKMSAILYFPI